MTTALVGGLDTGSIGAAALLDQVGDVTTIDCRGLHYRALNEAIRSAVVEGARTVHLLNVNGQRYIGTGLRGGDLRLEVHGTPGQAVAMFMDGPTVEIHGNAQDGVGNTMNAGEVVVRGSAGDVLGYGMRRGRIFVEGDVGYRAGIHMKAHDGCRPLIVCGGKARDYFGEYMAGGLLVLLGMNSGLDGPVVGSHVGTGMNGGAIFVRSELEAWQCGDEVRPMLATEPETEALGVVLGDYCDVFGLDLAEVLSVPFTRIGPAGCRPYAGLYTYV